MASLINLFDKYSWKTVSRLSLIFIILQSTTSIMWGQQVKPKLSLIASGAVTDFIVQDNVLYVATDQGIVDVFDLTDGSRATQIKLPPITDFMGDEIPAKVFSIDKSDDKLLLVIQGNHGFRNVLLYQDGEISKIIDADEDKMLVKKARFVDDNKVLFGLLSNELILFDHQQKQIIYNVQISAYSFSDFCLNDDKSQVITADESGIIHLIHTNDGKILNEYLGNNVDNVYKTVFQNATIITGGQDRRVGIYHTVVDDKYYIEGDFLVYSVGLSPDGSIGAFSASEDNDICLFNTNTKEIFQTLKGHNSTVTKIFFFNNSKLITSCDDPNIFIWEIPGE